MSKQEVIAIVNPWFGRDRSPPIEHGGYLGRDRRAGDRRRDARAGWTPTSLRSGRGSRIASSFISAAITGSSRADAEWGPRSFVDLEARR
jgi:hypothetical protein